MENETAKEILESTIQFRQIISLGNYSCVGIPYENALKAVNELSLQCAELQKDVEEWKLLFNQKLEQCNNAESFIEKLQSENESLKKRVEEVTEDYKNLNSLSIAMQKRIRSCSELEKAHEEYIKVLLDEIDSLVGLAAVHGWRSENVDRGKECRLKIATIKEALNQK